MPIKLPKGFARRKSSGNALEEVENLQDLAQPSSFKVFERPGGGSRSFDGVNTLKRMGQGRPLSSPGVLDDDDLFVDVRSDQPNNRGSGGTDNSASTGGLYDSSASSARFSSSSTLPSSTDIPTHGDNSFSLKRALQEIPVPPIPESRPVASLRAKAGRTFSFGMKSPKSSPMSSSRPGTAQIESPNVKTVTRERAMTASTASTATPPKLLDSDISFDSRSEGFSNMFDNYDDRRTPPLETQGFISRNTPSPNYGSSPLPPLPPQNHLYHRPSLVPSPINVDRTRPVESSPYSWDSQDSHEGLMNSSSPALVLSPQELPSIPRKNLPISKSMPIPETTSPTAQSKPDRPGFGLRRSSAYSGRRRSTPIEDENARLVQDSVPYSKKSFGPPPAFGRNPSPQVETQKAPVTLFDSDDGDLAGTSGWQDETSEQTPRPRKIVPYKESESPTRLDTSLAANARVASQYEQRQPSPTRGNNKVMTPAQFERYRKQQELTRTKTDASKSDDSEDGSDNYDDEDETERNRQAAKQRKKQEAHLAVYRQQMMKVTGEQVGDLPNLGQPTGSLSTPNLPSSRLSTLGPGNERGIDGGKQSDDEDEDVPLGILAAHGFPNKNRPPTRMSTAGSTANLRVPSQVGAPGSVIGESTAPGSRNSLPVFARGLPQDPYYGASLVNPGNREGLAMNGGVPVGQAGPPPGVPPGGLVGVIAGEERARAIRRGSPNAQGGYEPPMHPGMPRSQTMGNLGPMGPMGIPGMPGMPLSPGDQAQIQMSQQMTQMMQMQMQWMQQMQQMVQIGGGMPPGQMPPQMPQPPPGMNGFLASPGQMQRPMSMVSNSTPGSPMAQHDQRTLSMLDPSLSQWNRTSTFAPSINGLQGGQGYAPSIAPSERSNVGMASRYRPVSTMVPPSNKNMTTRASTFNSTTLQGWDNYQRQPQSQSTSTIKAVNSKADKAGSDDDDDEGWAEMKKKADRKRSTWKMRKGQHALQDIFHRGS